MRTILADFPLAAQTAYFDFDADEFIEIDRKEAAWPNNIAESDTLWNKRLKLLLLNSTLSGKKLEEARETLAKRYKRQLKRIQQEDSTDVFGTRRVKSAMRRLRGFTLVELLVVIAIIAMLIGILLCNI